MEDNKAKLVAVLRWSAFVPGALLSAWLAWIVVNILNRFSLGYMGIDLDSFMARLSLESTAHAAMGAAFVYVGAKIAPANRIIVAYCMAGVGLIISGFMLFPAIMVKNYWAIWGGICVIGGIGAVTYSIYQGETEIE